MFPQCVKSDIHREGGPAGQEMVPSGTATRLPVVPRSSCRIGKHASLPRPAWVGLVFCALRSISAFPAANHLGMAIRPETRTGSRFPDKPVIVLRQPCQVTRVSLFAFVSEVCPN